MIVDPFPSGLIVAPHPVPNPDPTSICNPPSLVVTFSPIAGDTSVGVTIPTMNPGFACTFTVYLQGTSPGLKTNTATPKSGNAGDGLPSTATVYVVTPLSLTKSFAAPKQVKANEKSTVTIVITNADPSTPQTGITLKDTFPSGMVVASTPPIPTNSCLGTFNPVPGAAFVQLTGGGPLGPGNSCTLTFAIVSTTGGLNANTTDKVSSLEGGLGNTGSDTLNVIVPLTGSKVFIPPSIFVGDHSTMKITLNNPNTVP